MKETSGMN